jgi:hypothetical protein
MLLLLLLFCSCACCCCHCCCIRLVRSQLLVCWRACCCCLIAFNLPTAHHTTTAASTRFWTAERSRWGTGTSQPAQLLEDCLMLFVKHPVDQVL